MIIIFLDTVNCHKGLRLALSSGSGLVGNLHPSYLMTETKPVSDVSNMTKLTINSIKNNNVHVVCVRACVYVCVCVRERERERVGVAFEKHEIEYHNYHF
jgi:hypothetical protein